jgi:hypothetical protein
MISDNITSLKQDTFHVKTGVLDLHRIEGSQYSLPASLYYDVNSSDKHRQKIIKWFSSVNVSANHYAACNKREPSTGDWFIRSPEFAQ